MMGTTGRGRSAVRLAGALIIVLGLGACAARYTNHGYIPPQEDLDQITVGKDTRETVQTLVGVPSAGSILNDSGYYFVRSRFRAVGPIAPQVTEREVVAISFDGRGIVSNVEHFGLERGRAVPLSRRVTTSGVGNDTFLRQLLGNLGRFNPAALAN